MEQLSHNDSATGFVGDFNTNAGETVLSVGNSATQAVNAINGVFDGIDGAADVSAESNSVDFINAINGNFEAMDSQGETSKDAVRFLHISDNHDSTDALLKCKELMGEDSSIDFTVLTGDYSPQTAYPSSTLVNAFADFGHEFLMLTGNHDIKNAFVDNQSNATAFLKRYVSDDVVWGDTNNVASYYYKDIQLSTKSKLRIIVMDSYDYRAGGAHAVYDTWYAGSQIRWLKDTLLGLSKDDFFIIAMHEPPINSTLTSVSVASPEPSAAALRRANKFCSANLFEWDSSLSNGDMCPVVVNAYTNKTHLQTRINNKNTSSGAVTSYTDVDFDFTSATPATFLCYLGGHLHGDMCAYHPSYPQQLILLVDNASGTLISSDSDIKSRSNGILINDVTLDFTNREIVITRIGQNQAGAYNGFPALTRDTITFPFVRELND